MMAFTAHFGVKLERAVLALVAPFRQVLEFGLRVRRICGCKEVPSQNPAQVPHLQTNDGHARGH